jgi:hypothetical protein
MSTAPNEKIFDRQHVMRNIVKQNYGKQSLRGENP